MLIRVVALIIAVLLVAAWVWWELRADRLARIAREEEELWLDQTRASDEMGKRWPAKTDL